VQGSNQISINQSSIVRLLGAIAFILVIASIGGQLILFLTGHQHWLTDLFNVDIEQNIPTLFSVFLLLFAALLLAIITAIKKKQRDSHVMYWTILSSGFLFMAIDEAVSMHEKLLLPSAQLLYLLGATPGHYGFFAFAWVAHGIALVIVLALFFWRFLLCQPRIIRNRFLVAGIIYIGGAIGMEMIGGRYFELHGANLTYRMLSNCEEGMEMAGVIFFIRALLLYINDYYEEVRFHFDGL
jgi:hypothetical protein